VSAAPDYLDPLVAWRAWLVVDEGEGARLRSVVFPASWLPHRELAAECRHRRWQLRRPWRHSEGHAAPASTCDCGIYGASELWLAVEYLGQSRIVGRAGKAVVGSAVGRVRLWGAVLEHKLGWRASRAYPADICVPAGPRADGVALDLAAYDVPVEVLDCSAPGDLLEALAERQQGD
jgi:hypothetical protein